MENNTDYIATSGKILIKSVAYISSIEIGVNKDARPLAPPQHFVISSSVLINIDNIPTNVEGMQVLIDEETVQATSIRVPVPTDKSDAKHIFNYVNKLTPPERMEYVKKHVKVKVHSYLFVNSHDIIAIVKTK